LHQHSVFWWRLLLSTWWSPTALPHRCENLSRCSFPRKTDGTKRNYGVSALISLLHTFACGVLLTNIIDAYATKSRTLQDVKHESVIAYAAAPPVTIQEVCRGLQRVFQQCIGAGAIVSI
jgi:hypothetical protein